MTHEIEVLNEREATHGDFAVTAKVAQRLKGVICCQDRSMGNKLSPIQAEALDQICTKIARILSGDPNEPDHWRDIQGYAGLALERLTPASEG